MDDILASIRRILNEEDKAAKAGEAPDEVLKLDQSMMVDENLAAGLADAAEERAPMTEPAPRPVEAANPPEPPRTAGPARPAEQALVAPEAAAVAASAVGNLMRTLVAERHASVHRGGPSIEDLVREEIRPLLKAWLDEHLPGLVERLVRTEIERVVGRITG